MIFRIARDPNFTAVRQNLIAFGYAPLRVIRAFGVDRRAKYIKDPGNVRFIKKNDMINATQRRDQRHAFVFGKNRPASILDRPHRFVAVDRDDEYISQGTCVFEVSQVPDMENVEATVSENDFFPLQTRRQVFKAPKFHFESCSTAFINSS